jgi:hypothetical protein
MMVVVHENVGTTGTARLYVLRLSDYSALRALHRPLTRADLDGYYYRRHVITSATMPAYDGTEQLALLLYDNRTDKSIIGYFDEIRVGTTVNDVLAIPEPVPGTLIYGK